MKTYKLYFAARGEQVVITVTAEILGLSTLKYKSIVDEKISEWLRANKLTANSTKILDVNLCDELECNLFNQADWSDPNSIIFK